MMLNQGHEITERSTIKLPSFSIPHTVGEGGRWNLFNFAQRGSRLPLVKSHEQARLPSTSWFEIGLDEVCDEQG